MDEGAVRDLVARRDAYIGKWLSTTEEGRKYVADLHAKLSGVSGRAAPAAEPEEGDDLAAIRKEIAELRGWRESREGQEKKTGEARRLQEEIGTAAKATVWGRDPEAGALIEDLIHNAVYEEETHGMSMGEIAKAVNAGFNEVIERIVARRLQARSAAARQPITGTASGGSGPRLGEATNYEDAGAEMLKILERTGGAL